MRASAVFLGLFLCLGFLASGQDKTLDSLPIYTSAITPDSTTDLDEILFFAQNSPLIDADLLENSLQNADSLTITSILHAELISSDVSQESKNELFKYYLNYLSVDFPLEKAVEPILNQANYYASKSQDSLSSLLLEADSLLQRSTAADSLRIPLLNRAASIAQLYGQQNLYEHFSSMKMDLERKEIPAGLAEPANNSAPVSSEEKIISVVNSQKKKLTAKKARLSELIHSTDELASALTNKKKAVQQVSDQTTQMIVSVDSLKHEKAKLEMVRTEMQTVAHFRAEKDKELFLYAYLAFGLILLICTPALYIGFRRTWQMRSNLVVYSEQLKDINDKLKSREQLADLGELSQNVARQIDQPIESIARISDELLPLIESINPAETITDQMPQLLKVKQSIHSIFDKGSSAERVVRTMLIHSSRRTEKADHVLNDLITDCLLLINSPLIEYAESVKGIKVTVNRTSFQHILLSILNRILSESKGERRTAKASAIRIVTSTADGKAVIRITHHGAHKALLVDAKLDEMVIADRGNLTESLDHHQLRTILLNYPM